MSRRALATKNAPRKIPLVFWAVVGLVMDRFNAPGWAWGVVGTCAVVGIVLCITDFFLSEEVEL
jgi:hypothetical protein